MSIFTGAGVAIVTPMKPDGEVNYEAFAKLTCGGLGELKVTSAAGTETGDTKITVSPAVTSGNSYKYKTGEMLDVPVKGQNVKNWPVWDGSADIKAASGNDIVIAECDASYYVVNAGKATVVSAE